MKVTVLKLGVLGTNCYIISDESNGIGAVIDPADKCGQIMSAIENDNVSLKYIFLTHGHFDHMLAAMPLKNETGAKIVINKYDRELLPVEVVSKFHRLLAKRYIEVVPDVLASDGEVFEIGEIRAKLIHTPGHTPGSSVLAVSDCLFTGDTLFRMTIGRCDLYKGNADDIARSLEKLSKIEIDYTVYPGHGEKSTLFFEKNNNPHMKSFKDKAEA